VSEWGKSSFLTGSPPDTRHRESPLSSEEGAKRETKLGQLGVLHGDSRAHRYPAAHGEGVETVKQNEDNVLSLGESVG